LRGIPTGGIKYNKFSVFFQKQASKVDLRIGDLIELLEIPEKTIIKWIKEKNLPAYKINNEYKFSRAEIKDWILKNNINVSSKILDLNITNKPVNLLELIDKGGIFYNIEGKLVKEIIENAVNTIHTPSELDKNEIITSLLQREEMMPTAVGKGIAIPHARNPIIADVENESVSLCFLKDAIDYNAIDGLPVYILFIILSANPKRHLEILSKVSFLCQQNDFMEKLNSKTEENEILKYIGNKEAEWQKRKS
jgi:nitrogen PTS system EIIA component